MTAQFTPLDQVQWKTVDYLWRDGEPPEYKLVLPRPLADWDVFQVWEAARVRSMQQHLDRGMVLFDVGTEQGWCNLAYAQMVGPENMVLIEPTPEFWPNIKATWEKNFGDNMPAGFLPALLSDKTAGKPYWTKCWPPQAVGDLIDRNKYQYIHDNTDGVPEMRLDQFALLTNLRPDALTIDVEGAELLVLRGAEKTLREYHPLVWVSIHPDMMQRDYGVAAEELHAFMADLGYTGEHLATDHEEHWFFS